MISKSTDFVSSSAEVLDISEGTRRQSRHTPVWQVLPTPYSPTNASCRNCVDYLKYKPFVILMFTLCRPYIVNLFIFFSQLIFFIDEIVIIISLQYLLTLS